MKRTQIISERSAVSSASGRSDHLSQIFTNKPVSAGVNSLTFPVPAGASRQTTTFARFRISTAGNLSPTGLALDGEVEDYVITTAPVEIYSFTID